MIQYIEEMVVTCDEFQRVNLRGKAALETMDKFQGSNN